MNIVFRVDSSVEIGAGHLMRCLALAEKMFLSGIDVTFVARKHDGNLNSLVVDKGFNLVELEIRETIYNQSESHHLNWLGSSWEDDYRQMQEVITSRKADVVLVDHYAIDSKWEGEIRLTCKKLVVIDDLANRSHSCDLLIDQTYGRQLKTYVPYIDKDCLCLLGSDYAILRQEFVDLRKCSLKRRPLEAYNRVLISLGGVDKGNVTAEVLTALASCSLGDNTEVTVVLGKHAPHKQEILDLIDQLPYRARLLIGVNNMAELMAYSDLAIGAAGSSAWERCCLGLPTIMIIIANNQRTIAKNLADVGAAILLEEPIKNNMAQLFSAQLTQQLEVVSQKSAALVDGLGCERIIDQLKASLCQIT